ncbi:MBL fold metallo-hydrolase [Aestuariivirga sp.]|uniref:MBL fold metallo-hydrolase n=1 Tax=Aestuariivirga sp. TaxID=2650926 RepID=UPI0035930BB9
MPATRDPHANDLWPLSRRKFLTLAGVSLTMPWTSRWALAAPLDIGGAEVTVVSDGQLNLPLSFVLPDIPEPEIKTLFDANGMAMEAFAPDCNVTLLRKDGRLAIFDAGSGSNFMPTAGKLLDGLSAASIDPAEVTDVIFTHGHPDHLWGVLDDLDELVFPNASYRMGKAEWDFWRDPGTVEAMPEERKSFAVGAQTRLAAIEEKIVLFGAGEEVFSGVEAVDTAGHTPGHMSFMVHGSSDKVFIVGDAISHAVISFQKPDWHSGSDQDAPRGAKTRTALLDRLATEKPRIIGYHLPHPGIGRVERKDAAFAFVPEE